MSMSMSAMRRRAKRRIDTSDPGKGVELAALLFRNGKADEAFDLIEGLVLAHPAASVSILGVAWDMYQALPEKSRYHLYQSRVFEFGIGRADKVLDIGSGHIPFPFATHLADITLTRHEVGRAGAPFKHVGGKPVYECSVEATPFADKEFDFVYCSHVLEHVDSPERACSELMRIGRRGYIETPSRGKDVLLNSAKASNHRWCVELVHGTLVFTEYEDDEVEGLGCDILMHMHTQPQTAREKAFAASIYLRAPHVNTMLLWEDGFPFEVRRKKAGSTVVAAFGPARIAPEARFDMDPPARPAPEAPERREAPAGKLTMLQVHTFYPSYLNWFYENAPGLGDGAFEAQTAALVRDGFSGIHMLAPYLGELGYDARLIVANNPVSQAAWLRENGLALKGVDNWIEDIVRLQIERYAPDVVYFTDPITFQSPFIRSLARKPGVIVGWRAANIPPGTDWSEYDVILSNLSGLRQAALGLGARAAEHFAPGFPDWIASEVADVRPEHDVVFTGQYTLGQHPRRNHFLRVLAAAASSPAAPYSCALHLSGDLHAVPQDMRPFLRPPVYGMAMHRTLRSGRIAFDGRGSIGLLGSGAPGAQDLARNESANMRIFEATGSGAFLLTEHFDNLARYFEIGTEIETFSDERELVDKIRHYLAHPEQRAEIAAAGQARCLRDHSMGSRLRDFDTIIRGVLEKKGRAGQAAPSCSVDPASATRGPLRGNGGSAGEPAGGTVLKALERSCGRLKKLIEDGDEKTRAAIAPEARKLVVELMARADGSAAETPQAALHLTSLAKSLRQPVPGLDVLRAKVFLGLGQERAAVQSLYEELRYFPDNEQARGLLGRLDSARVWRVDDAELDQALETIRPYTMVVEPHLLNLYLLAKKVCEADVPGDFVECGVAAGGTSALLAWVVKRFSKRPRRLFACDSFEGMPSPSEHDVHDSVPAEETGWGTGTCAAPQESLAEICRSLGVEDIVSPVKGYFKDTLPLLRERLGQVALLHMDGDWYDSTRDILVNLHDRLHEDALVQVDDYGHWDGCRKAVHDFAAERGVRMSLRRIEQGTGVWFAVKHARMVAEAVTR